MDYLLDPYVLAIPNHSSDWHDVESYLFNLNSWSHGTRNQDIAFWVSRPAVAALWEQNKYPRYSHLQQLYERHPDIEKFDVVLVSRACQKWNTPPYIEDRLEEEFPEILEIILDEESTTLIPDKIATRLDPEVLDGLCETLAKLAFTKDRHPKNWVDELLFATSALAEDDERINVQASCYDDSKEGFIDVEGNWLTVIDPIQVTELPKLHENWEDTSHAVSWAYEDLIRRGKLDPTKYILPSSKEWDPGDHFNSSIKKYHFDRQDLLVSIFHAVVKVLVGYWPRETETKENHHLQRDHEQIIREKDQAAAWRAWVTKDKNPLRLHYWLIDERKIEFSIVVPHNKLYIK